MNNPFFDQARDGCKKAEKESKGAIECLYIGPGEHGGGEEQVQVVNDLIARKVDGIAVSPPTRPRWASALNAAKAAGIPVLTWDSDLLDRRQGSAHRLHRHAQLRHRRQPREAGAWRSSRRAARSASSPAAPRRPITTSACRASATRCPASRARRARRAADRARTAGPRSTAARSTPMMISRAAVQQMEDILGKYPTLDAFVPTGGFPQFIPQAYRKVAEKVEIANRGRLARPGRRRHACRADRSVEGGLVRRSGRPTAVRDGLQERCVPEGHQGRQAGSDGSDLHRPRRLHREECGDLHRRVDPAAVCFGARDGYSGPPTAVPDTGVRLDYAATRRCRWRKGCAEPSFPRLEHSLPHRRPNRRSISVSLSTMKVGRPWLQTSAPGVASISRKSASISSARSRLPARTEP